MTTTLRLGGCVAISRADSHPRLCACRCLVLNYPRPCCIFVCIRARARARALLLLYRHLFLTCAPGGCGGSLYVAGALCSTTGLNTPQTGCFRVNCSASGLSFTVTAKNGNSATCFSNGACTMARWPRTRVPCCMRAAFDLVAFTTRAASVTTAVLLPSVACTYSLHRSSCVVTLQARRCPSPGTAAC
jgi:hypothetical protein